MRSGSFFHLRGLGYSECTKQPCLVCRDEREQIRPSLALKSESWRLLTQPKPYSETSEWQAAERGVRERSRATVSQLIRQRVKKETKLERGTGSALVLKAKSHMKDKTQHETRNS